MDHLQYISTRGGMEPSTFSDVLLNGLAPDGGLVVPTVIPQISHQQREQWRGLTYPELAAKIIGLYAPEISSADLSNITHAAYSPVRFAEPVVPLKPLDDSTTLVGLSEGPTMAFKDLAMQFLGEAIPYILAKTDRRLNILGATSGDTGSAAEHAFRGKPGINVFMLSPQGRMSDVQRAQMYSVDDPNIFNIAVEGVFDDCQNLVKAVNEDAEFKQQHAIGAVNSINFGRIVAQVVYYFWAWLRATDDLDAKQRKDAQLSFAVPSGNFGNVYAGNLARSMQLPIAKLIVATNENNVLDEFFTTGKYAPRTSAQTLATSSPSMDISKASNLERFLWQLLGPEQFVQAWAQLQQSGVLDLSDRLGEIHVKYGFISGTSTHQDRLASIKQTFESTGVVIDPHTADAITVVHKLALPGKVLAMETALPAKFSQTVSEALGDSVNVITPAVKELLELPQHVVSIDNDVEELRSFIAERTSAVAS